LNEAAIFAGRGVDRPTKTAPRIPRRWRGVSTKALKSGSITMAASMPTCLKGQGRRLSPRAPELKRAIQRRVGKAGVFVKKGELSWIDGFRLRR